MNRIIAHFFYIFTKSIPSLEVFWLDRFWDDTSRANLASCDAIKFVSVAFVDDQVIILVNIESLRFSVSNKRFVEFI